ncbi:MAG: CHAT domain-containing protein [Firmicutes bacterium]|nr:CHAT domain-containing protein [Bacillota bacterium]
MIISLLLPVQADENSAGNLLHKADDLIGNSDYTSALKTLDEAFTSAVKTGDIKTQLNSLLLQYRCRFETADYNNAIIAAQKSLDLLSQYDKSDLSEKQKNELLFFFRTKLTEAYCERKAYDKAWELMDELEQADRKSFSKNTNIRFYITRGKLLKTKEDFDLSIKNFEEAAKLSSDENDIYSEVTSVCGLVRMLAAKRDFEKAGGKLAEIQMKSAECPALYLQLLILQTYAELKADEEKKPSLSHAFAALALASSMGNKGKQSDILIWIGSFLEDKGDLEKACEFIKKANKLAVESGNTYQQFRSAYELLGASSDYGLKPVFEEAKGMLLAAGDASPFVYDRLSSAYYTARAIQYTEKKLDLAEKLTIDLIEQSEKQQQHKMQVQSLYILGNIYISKARYEDAIVCYRKAIEVYGKLPPQKEYMDKYFFVYCTKTYLLNSIGTAYLLLNDYGKATQVFRDSIVADTSRDAAFIRMWPRTSLLAVCLLSYDFSSAREVIIDSLRDFKTIKNPIKRAVAYNMLITFLSGFSKQRGINNTDFLNQSESSSPGSIIKEKFFSNAELVKEFEDAYKDWIKYSEERNDYSSLSLAYVFQGFLFSTINKDTEALDSINKGIEYAKTSNISRFEGIGYIYLSDLYIKQKNYQEAFRVNLLGLDCAKKNGDHESEYRSLIYLGLISKQLNKPDLAEKYIKQALEKCAQTGYTNFKGSTLIILSNLYYMEKKYYESQQLILEALKIFRKTGERSRTAYCLFAAARNYRYLNSGKEEIPSLYKEAYELYLSLGSMFELRDVAISYGEWLLSEGREKEALDVYLKAIDAFIGWRDKLPAYTGRDKLVDIRENRILFEGAVNLLIKFNRYEEALKYLSLSKSVELVDSFNAAEIKTGDPAGQQLLVKIDDLKSRMILLSRQIEDEKDLKRKQSLSGILASTREDFFRAMNEIRSKNPDLEQLLAVRGTELASLQKVIPSDCVLVEYYPSGEKLYIFIVTSGSLKIRQIEIKRERLYEAVKNYRLAILEKQDINSEKFVSERQFLYSCLIGSIKDEIADKRNVLAVPGGMLWYLPLETLGAEKDKYFLQEKNVSYISSSSVLTGGNRNNTSAVLAAFGAPSGSGLPFSAEEVKNIGGIYPGSFIFIGENATKANFMKAAPKSSMIHIATHSHLDKKDINNSFISFAGADGTLKLGEIYGIHLPASSLVVLSSCESALGDDAPGAEFASLGTAFGMAGASSVIASLWKVEDSSCSVLFSEFYKNLKMGKSRSESLRLAKLKLLSSPATAHPYYWGAFILTGDWR